MPSVGHVAIGLAAARRAAVPDGVHPWTWASSLIALSLLPDLDVVAFRLGIPYGAPFGHRGAIHSLTFALIVAVLVWSGAAAAKLKPFPMFIVAFLVVASHGLLDTLTDGGKGIALLWPFSNTRYFAPWRPIPVAPIGARLFSTAGIRLMLYEAVLFFPVFLIAAWPRSANWKENSSLRKSLTRASSLFIRTGQRQLVGYSFRNKYKT
jgi:inner membrane protein